MKRTRARSAAGPSVPKGKKRAAHFKQAVSTGGLVTREDKIKLVQQLCKGFVRYMNVTSEFKARPPGCRCNMHCGKNHTKGKWLVHIFGTTLAKKVYDTARKKWRRKFSSASVPSNHARCKERSCHCVWNKIVVVGLGHVCCHACCHALASCCHVGRPCQS